MNAASAIERRRVRVRRTVQGVGFRPFVWRLAHDLAHDGWVANDAEGVIAEVQGEAGALDRFAQRLRHLAGEIITNVRDAVAEQLKKLGLTWESARVHH